MVFKEVIACSAWLCDQSMLYDEILAAEAATARDVCYQMQHGSVAESGGA